MVSLELGLDVLVVVGLELAGKKFNIQFNEEPCTHRFRRLLWLPLGRAKSALEMSPYLSQ